MAGAGCKGRVRRLDNLGRRGRRHSCLMLRLTQVRLMGVSWGTPIFNIGSGVLGCYFGWLFWGVTGVHFFGAEVYVYCGSDSYQ
jgi:hypothetical protein